MEPVKRCPGQDPPAPLGGFLASHGTGLLEDVHETEAARRFLGSEDGERGVHPLSVHAQKDTSRSLRKTVVPLLPGNVLSWGVGKERVG